MEPESDSSHKICIVFYFDKCSVEFTMQRSSKEGFATTTTSDFSRRYKTHKTVSYVNTP